MRARIGLLAHEPLLYRELTARENLRFHARLHRVGFERVEQALAEVGMERRADEPIRTLSRGMVQRVAIARPCSTSPNCCCSTSPTRTSTQPPSSWSPPLIGPGAAHARDLQP